jgi:hypothetical protein
MLRISVSLIRGEQAAAGLRTRYTLGTRYPRLSVCLLALSLTAAAMGEDAVHFRSIVVRFDLAADGAMHITEEAQLDIPDGVDTAERRYWADAEQRVTFDRITRVDLAPPIEKRFATPSNGTVTWQVSPGTATYVIESTIADAVIPAWSLPRGRLTHDASGLLADPAQRARTLLALWKEAAQQPRSRYLLDYQYPMGPVSEEGTDIALQLFWADGWTPVHTITGDTIATKLEHTPIDTTRWRVTHLFDYVRAGTPPAVDVRRHLLRMVAIAGFPVACLILWLLFLAREMLRRGIRREPDVDERALQETVYAEPPEVVAAQWTGIASAPRIEPFLRRLEKRGKLRIGVEPRGEDDEPLVTLRLIAPREQLSPYERAGIDALIPDGWETSSDAIVKRRDYEGFDPLATLTAELNRIAVEHGGKAKAPWYSKLTSFAIFAGGVYLLLQETIRYQHEPALLVAALVFSSSLSSIWPDVVVRTAIRNRLRWSLLLLIPALIATAAMAFAYAALEQPPGVYGAAGLSLLLLATYKAMLAANATRAPRTARQRLAELARARTWFRAELRRDHPRLRDDVIPWLEALGLRPDINRWRRRFPKTGGGWTGVAPPHADEGWGESLVA